MEGKRYELGSVRPASAAVALAGTADWWTALKARPTPNTRALARRALQIALLVLVPGGSILLALLWWFDQRGEA